MLANILSSSDALQLSPAHDVHADMLSVVVVSEQDVVLLLNICLNDTKHDEWMLTLRWCLLNDTTAI